MQSADSLPSSSIALGEVGVSCPRPRHHSSQYQMHGHATLERQASGDWEMVDREGVRFAADRAAAGDATWGRSLA